MQHHATMEWLKLKFKKPNKVQKQVNKTRTFNKTFTKTFNKNKFW